MIVWILDGQSDHDIIEAIASEFPDGPAPEALISAAMDHFSSVGRADHDIIRGWSIEASRHVYAKMMEIGDYANALRAIKQIMALAPPPP